MSVIQSQQDEVRFLKRKNLEEEARIHGNMLADQIRMYGVDCTYYKLNTDVFGNYRDIVDRNTLLKHAYKGYDLVPDYTCSASMITFPEMQQDIFQLNKYGIVPEAEVDFHFDAKQFACDLAVKCGQLKEYKIQPQVIECEVPECGALSCISTDPMTGEDISVFLSSQLFPYKLGLNYKETYECGTLNGKLSVEIPCYELSAKYKAVCDPYEHTKFEVNIPKNSDLYKSLMYKVCSDGYLDTLIYLDYVVNRIATSIDKEGNITYKNVLSGVVSGSILFYDLNKIGKYIEMIHPEVGDVIEIDFPDDKNREKYKITDCYDKSLQSDGISPLLHKYVWKCKAKRYVDSYEDLGPESNEADKQLEEKLKHDAVVEEEVVRKISLYDEGDQEAYGGYEGVIGEYDKMNPDKYHAEKYDYLADGQCLDIIRFGCGSRLVTNGYDLIFIAAPVNGNAGDGYLVTTTQQDVGSAIFESGLRWLKASNDKIVFVNIEGTSTTIAEDEVATQNQLELCLNDLNEKTLDVADINSNGENFLKFKGTRSYLWSDGKHLFAKLQSNKELYKIV